MSGVRLSKTKYCHCVQCKKMFWLSKYRNDCSDGIDRTVLFENGKRVGNIAKGLFGKHEDIQFDRTLTPMIERTEMLLEKKPNVITEASFSYDNNFCSVDILKNDEDGVEIYEVKSTTKIQDIYYDDVAFQYFVLSSLGLNVKRACLVIISKEYVKGKRPVEEELDKYFSIVDITDIVLEKQDEVREGIAEIREYMSMHDESNEPGDDIGIHCFSPYSCDFWKYCTRDLPSPNVFDVKGMGRDMKFEFYANGKVSFEDLEHESMNPRFMEQIDFELNDRDPKIDRKAIEAILNSLKYPLCFIDYETYNTPLPEIEGTRPNQKLPFQYSLHIIDEDGKMEHREFLAKPDDDDFIRHFAESMIKDLEDRGSVIVYNRTFESSVNNGLAEMFPEFKSQIEEINGDMVDFMVPFRSRSYYMKEMQGSYSIKHVLPALYPDDPDLGYINLDGVHDGMEASNAFVESRGKSKEEQDKIRNDLLEYCKLDTLAMVKIWENFKEIVNE